MNHDSTRPTTTRRPVSLRFRDMVPDNDAGQNVADWEPEPTYGPQRRLSTIREWQPGKQDLKLAITAPKSVHHALQSQVLDAGRGASVTKAGLCALHFGLDHFDNHPDVRTICDARAAVLQSGSVDIVQLDYWAYHIAGRDGSHRLFLKGVSVRNLARSKSLGEGLGLSTSTVGALAIMAGLEGVSLPGDLSRLVLIELREFFRALRTRAILAADLRERAAGAPQDSSAFRWSDVESE